MPRLAASSRGTGLSERNSENNTNITSMKGKGAMENRTRSSVGVKRQAEESTLKAPEYNAKTRRRAALGEITNAKGGAIAKASEKECKTLKSQMKKGLSVIVNRTTNNTASLKPTATKNKSISNEIKLTSKASTKNTNLKTNGSTFVNQVPSKKSKRSREIAETSTSSLEEDIEMLSFEGKTDSSSLPSSQETEELAQQLKDKATGLYTSENETQSTFSSSHLEENIDIDLSIKERSEENPQSSRYIPPPRILPPEGIQDFDLENWRDPSQCSEYAQDIFQYYKNREEQFRCPDYLHSMPTGKRRGSIGKADITEGMRAILVDWLVEVQESFELNHETLYTAVKLMDLYLSKVFVTKEELQLIGATSCLIACKIDERIPPNLDDFVYVCDDAYSRQEIMAKERDMIETVNYDVGYPLSYRFLRRFGRVCQVTMPVLTLARYILETSLMEYKFNVELSESILAAATLALAMKVSNIDQTKWIGPLKFYSGHDISTIKPVFHALHQMLFQEAKDSTKTIRQKYSHRVFHEVALIKIPNTLDL